ncbi:MAG TPA: GtrA family protein [Mycobacteriales bacterium]|nr:GtrA family protein [Mycobacteriales bacterium]
MAEDRVAPVASPFTVLAAEAAESGQGRPTLFESLMRFCVTGLGSLGADFGVLALLHSVAHVPLAIATFLGSAAAMLVNYTLNRNWSFQAQAGHGSTLPRYAFMVGVNVGSTLLIVLLLSHLGLYYLVSKLVAVAVNAGSNFLAGRYWIFKH